MKISDCIAVVTGGASGLGEATARMLVREGGQAAILDLDEERGQKIASELGDRAIFCKTDVADEESVQGAIDKTLESFGGFISLSTVQVFHRPQRCSEKTARYPYHFLIRSCRSI